MACIIDGRVHKFNVLPKGYRHRAINTGPPGVQSEWADVLAKQEGTWGYCKVPQGHFSLNLSCRRSIPFLNF